MILRISRISCFCSKEHELKPYEATPVIVGLVLTFTIVKLIGPNKRSNLNTVKYSKEKLFDEHA